MNTLVITITAVLMFTGLIGSVIPMIPGSPLILLGAFIYAWHTNFEAVTWGTLAILLLLVVLSQILDPLASLLGAKKFGASRWGMVGAFLGGMIGLFFGGFLGILVGPFVGALLIELFRGRDLNTSMKIGLGTLIGFLAGAVGKIVISITMIGIFLIKII